jgi:hypothetical protein
MNRLWITFVLATAIARPLVSSPAFAQGNPPGTVTANAAIAGAEQFASDLHRGGNTTLSAGVMRQFVPAFAAGVTVRYDYQSWRFDSPTAFGSDGPWRDLHHGSVGLNLSLALSRSLLLGVSPAVEWAGEPGTDAGDGLIYGAVVSVAKVVSPRLVLGGGASVSRQFYNVKTSPFVIINWRITDRLRVANAAGASPLGGAGVEMRYAVTPDWEVAGGGVYRSDRFRLDARGRYAGQVGEAAGIPLLARISRRLDARSAVSVYAGAVIDGSLKIRDSDGREIVSDAYRPAPLVALMLMRRF